MELDTLRLRAVRGTFVLVIRKFFLRGVSYASFLILAAVLTPSDFGVFAIVNFFITFLGFFSDIGLGAALIQKEKVTDKALTTTFTLQQAMVTLLVVIAWAGSPYVSVAYHLGQSGIWLIRALSISLFLTSLKTIPMILLERTLRFNRVIIPEVVEVLSYQAVAIILALLGFGVWSFVWAVLARGVLGVLAMYIVSPWMPKLAWDGEVAKRLVGFGVPYQSNYFIALLKDAVTPVFVGIISGKSAVGYLNWAFTISKAPIEIISDVFRVTFPAYARIQHDPDLLRRAIETSLKYTNMILFPGVVLVAMLVAPINEILFDGKWTPALNAVYIHSAGLMLFGIISTATNALWAMGKVRDGVIFMLIATVVNWAVSIPAVFMVGYNGAMIGSTTVLFISLPLSLMLLAKHVSVHVWAHTLPYALASLSIVGVLAAARPYLATFPGIAFWALIAAVAYALVLYALRKKALIDDILWVWRSLSNKTSQ